MFDMQGEKDFSIITMCLYIITILRKYFKKLTMHYWYTRFYMRKITINFHFSETLTNTCEHKIKSFTIE